MSFEDYENNRRLCVFVRVSVFAGAQSCLANRVSCANLVCVQSEKRPFIFIAFSSCLKLNKRMIMNLLSVLPCQTQATTTFFASLAWKLRQRQNWRSNSFSPSASFGFAKSELVLLQNSKLFLEASAFCKRLQRRHLIEAADRTQVKLHNLQVRDTRSTMFFLLGIVTMCMLFC